jgi:putative endopeptidase
MILVRARALGVALFLFGATGLGGACVRKAQPGSVAPAPTASSPPSTPPSADTKLPRQTGADEAAMDRTASPCDDFYAFACGGWMKATPIPDDESSWVRSFSVIHRENEEALRDILERDAKGDTQGDAYGAQLGDLWASCMDEPTVEKRALADLAPELAAIDAVRDVKSLVQAVAHMHSIGVGAVFDFDSEVDFKDASRMIAGVSQAGLGLPERDYYFRNDKRTKDIRDEYLAHVSRTFQLLGETPKIADGHANTVMTLEATLARASMTNTELRDPQKIYHRLDLEGLKRIAPDVSWDLYLGTVGFPDIRSINVGQPDFVKKFNELAKTVPPADWRVYLRWHLLVSVSPWLSKPFVDEWFHFRQVLTGAKSLQPRWKRCVRFADQGMGEALAQPFVKKFLGDEGKAAAKRMVAGIEASMKLDIEALAWMDDPTRAKAEEKLAKVVNKIGYPESWRSYAGLVTDRSSFVGNVRKANELEVRRRLAKVGKQVDKGEWEMTPPTVNAYYEPTMNEMVFPAGILRAPFYAQTQIPALNFGAIGMVVGHELTHGFDDEGRQFDADGNLRDWWTGAVGSEFDKRASCVEHQFDAYVAVDDSHIKGKLTLGENIADLGGVKLALSTLERGENAADAASTKTGTFTPEQQFFLGFAQSWCANYRPEALRLLVATNPHSPPRFRVNGPLSNMAEFASAFQCKEGAPMVRSARDRCEIW